MVHFITRGHGTILSVILTERNGAAFPETNSSSVRTQAALYLPGPLSGMESRA